MKPRTKFESYLRNKARALVHEILDYLGCNVVVFRSK